MISALLVKDLEASHPTNPNTAFPDKGLYARHHSVSRICNDIVKKYLTNEIIVYVDLSFVGLCTLEA